ncbi:substrate-binding domain-containing protein [Acaryochloris marina]|uniref:substrate-binding domain-containing protein n=1 Tax=Acaryochloris marina TaxID=155978 RepID=UPI001BB0421A|nr:substrate-binding domain-containing protein [Acaryochloris marina]QUY41800.1 substrate-binding domain-containing protein [Acaryochloris marina S15]
MVKSQRSLYISLAIIAAALGLTFYPLPDDQVQTLVVVSGSELEPPLKKLIETFHQQQSKIRIDLKVQGSLDMVNRFIDDRNDFQPTVLIPANQDTLKRLEQRWTDSEPAFYGEPQPLAKTRLVAITWPERGKALFPDGKFSWNRVEMAMKSQQWGSFGGSANWGSFDFVMTDPTRSNSGQMTLSLWLSHKLQKSSLQTADLNGPTAQSAVSTLKRSIYQPARSSDILMQEFVARGANDADIITNYESVALNRWQQSKVSQGQPYQIYEINPTVETKPTAAIVRRQVDEPMAKKARDFIEYLSQPDQQKVFIEYGFRPVHPDVKLENNATALWKQNTGVLLKPKAQVVDPPAVTVLRELGRLWERSQP